MSSNTDELNRLASLKTNTEVKSPALKDGLGVPLDEVKDPDKLRHMAAMLWQLLDDIDTASDVAKDRDGYYRNLVEEIQKCRHNILTSDGYELYMPKEKHT